MLAGEPPFTGPTLQAIVAKMMSTERRPCACCARESRRRWAQVLSARARAPPLATGGSPRASSARRWMRLAARDAGEWTGGVLSELRRARLKMSRVAGVSLSTGFLIGVVLFAYSSRARNEAPGCRRGDSPRSAPVRERGRFLPTATSPTGMTDAVHDKLTGVPGLEVIGSASSRSVPRHEEGAAGDREGARRAVISVEGRIAVGRRALVEASRVRVNPELIYVFERGRTNGRSRSTRR